jgi:hypothetical protein
VRTGEEPMLIETVDGEVHLRQGSAQDPDAVLSGSPHMILAVISGGLDLAEAEARGLRREGSRRSVTRVLPERAAAAAARAASG